MAGNRARSFGVFTATVAAVLTLGATQVSGQAVDLTGTWSMEVTTDQGTTTPSMTLEQHGDHVMGRYSSETLGDADLEGSVTGNQVRLAFEADLQGQAVPVVYVATIDANGVMSGTIDLAGGLATGTFTARRASE
ncbi:MAG TPA: hypothetical protein VM198_04090 [Longimicrobiales bacterium]|nr:hypothetical protein [Longimicrobiales bacterium]